METIEFIGFFAGILVAISSFPQLIKSWKTRSTRDIALSWLMINICGQVIWIIYGVLKASQSLVVMSSITLIMVGSVLVLKIRYR